VKIILLRQLHVDASDDMTPDFDFGGMLTRPAEGL
jgi:hypothetical protein